MATNMPVIRPLGDTETHIRAYHFIMPFHQIRPSKSETGAAMDAGHIWVPMDDDNTMVYNWIFRRTARPLNEEDRLERGIGNGPLHVDQTTFRSFANKSNNYLLDRNVQQNETFTGIDGINAQDRAIQESMGRGRRPVAGASGSSRQGDHPAAQEAPRRRPRRRSRR